MMHAITTLINSDGVALFHFTQEYGKESPPMKWLWYLQLACCDYGNLLHWKHQKNFIIILLSLLVKKANGLKFSHWNLQLKNERWCDIISAIISSKRLHIVFLFSPLILKIRWLTLPTQPNPTVCIFLAQQIELNMNFLTSERPATNRFRRGDGGGQIGEEHRL